MAADLNERAVKEHVSSKVKCLTQSEKRMKWITSKEDFETLESESDLSAEPRLDDLESGNLEKQTSLITRGRDIDGQGNRVSGDSENAAASKIKGTDTQPNGLEEALTVVEQMLKEYVHNDGDGEDDRGYKAHASKEDRSKSDDNNLELALDMVEKAVEKAHCLQEHLSEKTMEKHESVDNINNVYNIYVNVDNHEKITHTTTTQLGDVTNSNVDFSVGNEEND